MQTSLDVGVEEGSQYSVTCSVGAATTGVAVVLLVQDPVDMEPGAPCCRLTPVQDAGWEEGNRRRGGGAGGGRVWRVSGGHEIGGGFCGPQKKGLPSACHWQVLYLAVVVALDWR